MNLVLVAILIIILTVSVIFVTTLSFDDTAFIQGIEFLVKEGIIPV